MTSATSNIAFGDAYSSVQANNINGSVHIGLENTLDRLPRAGEAPFNSYARQHEDVCLPDTRVDLLQEIYSWADGQDERCIYWLSGLAGTGKSTIARTVAENYYANQRLAASFFFSRGGGNVSHAGLFVTSIAVQLADNVPASRHYIRDAVAERSDIARQSLRDQWQRLVLRPLSKLREAGSYIIVVDALDECDNDDNIRTIVQLLAEVRPSLTGVRLRVLLTSRPEVPIRHGFGQMADSKHKDVVLHNLSPSVVDHDIGLFLEYWLRKIAKDYYYADDWPGAEIIRKLVQGACGLFIWAATARRFIQEGGQFADDRLRIILKDSAITDNLSKDGSSSEDSSTDDQLEIPPEKRLDSIYLTVLKRPIRRYRKYERKKWYGLMKEVLGAIVLLYSPLSATSLARLLVISPGEVHRTLDELHSILDVPKCPTDYVRLHHPSFRDFILNEDRCRDANLWVEERQAHTALADKCIKLLSRSLKQDICAVGHFGTRAAEIDRKQLEDCILPEMQYACLYWTNHLAKSEVRLHDDDKVHDFLKKHFLHWLEALSWMGKVSESIYAISSLESIALASECADLCELIHDMKRFALYNRVPIEIAPLQVYSSALLFAPTNSIVKRQFADQLTQWIKSPPQVDDEWSACLQTLEGHSDSIDSAVFSHDSTRLASVSDDGQAKIWDVRSGECLKTFEIHDFNHSVAFSHDLTWLASWSYNSTTIKIWDINSGACLNTLEAYTSVHLIAFSHASMKLASVSFKGAIEIWDASSGVCLSTSKIPECNLYLKAFSHDLMHLAAVSDDNKTIQIWDNTSGECVQTLDSHFDSVMPLAFSQDSAWLASAPDDYTAINIWDVSSGACLHTLEGHEDDVTSVAFSHDSMRLASASYDQTVMIWDTSNGACLQIYKGHSRMINSIAFSHDSAQLASASRDMTVKIWDTGSNTCLRTHKDNNEDVRSMTFTHDWMQQILDTTACTCPESDEHGGRKRRSTRPSTAIRRDSRWIARGFENGTIKIKDRESGAHLKTLEGHCGSIEKLAVSHDSTRLASMSQDKTVKIWDVSSGACLQTIESYSGCYFSSIAFSHGSMLLALAFDDGTVQIWDISSGTFLRTFYGHNRFVDNVGFSDDSTKLASVSFDRTVTVWDTSSGARLHTFKTCVLSRVTDIFRLPRFEGTVAPQQTTNCSINISQDNNWLSLNGQERLWLPVEYRPGHFFISDRCITIAKRSGKTWRCRFV